ncbi:uncharacterized protein A4U43_C08F29240 [Asparagus officinalis]|nr:uncharacterized protein A4U43_C08F29240 [Asparagus officinalis]
MREEGGNSNDGGDPQRIKRAAVVSYDYDSDPRWSDCWSNILIPPTRCQDPKSLSTSSANSTRDSSSLASARQRLPPLDAVSHHRIKLMLVEFAYVVFSSSKLRSRSVNSGSRPGLGPVSGPDPRKTWVSGLDRAPSPGPGRLGRSHIGPSPAQQGTWPYLFGPTQGSTVNSLTVDPARTRPSPMVKI